MRLAAADIRYNLEYKFLNLRILLGRRYIPRGSNVFFIDLPTWFKLFKPEYSFSLMII